MSIAAMFAKATTLNATLGWVTKPVLQASIDGWLPPKLGLMKIIKLRMFVNHLFCYWFNSDFYGFKS